MVGSTRDRNDDELRREHDEGPDYARGQDHEEIPGDGGPDFAHGQRQDGAGAHEGNFAEGQTHPGQYVEDTDHPDFARGQRREGPDRT
jgi:hypothetical protein